MRGYSVVTFAVALSAICLSGLTSAAPAAHKALPVCPDDDSGDVIFFPNPANCSQYFECDNGVLTLMECPDNLQWNTELNVCDHPENVECEAETKLKVVAVPHLAAPVCPDDPSGNVTFFPNPQNCSEYFACDNGLLTIMECPDGLQWNTELNVCDHPENVECEAETKLKVVAMPHLSAPVCPDDPSGNVTFFPNPQNCSEYFECDNGLLTNMECPDGLQWNTELNVCDHPENVECEVESHIQSLKKEVPKVHRAHHGHIHHHHTVKLVQLRKNHLKHH